MLRAAPGFYVGVALAALFAVGPQGYVLDATSVNFRLQATVDLYETTHVIPVRLHINEGYLYDQSANALAGLNTRLQMSLPGYNAVACSMAPSTNPLAPRNQNVACQDQLTRFERFGWSTNHADRAYVTAALEAWAPSIPALRAFVEYTFAVPIITSGYVCYNSVTYPGDTDKCLAAVDTISASPSYLTLGARAEVFRGRAMVQVGVDVATGGDAVFVRELAPTPPWTAYAGIEFALDLVARPRS